MKDAHLASPEASEPCWRGLGLDAHLNMSAVLESGGGVCIFSP